MKQKVAWWAFAASLVWLAPAGLAESANGASPVAAPPVYPVQQPQDRQDGAGAAMAMGMAGAAIAGAACLKLLKDAQEAPEEQKPMLQAMAMQECAQAAQNAGNAAQNSNSKNAATDTSTPQMNTLYPSTADSSQNQNPSSPSLPTLPSTNNTPSQLVDAQNAQAPSPQVFDSSPASQLTVASATPSTSKLSPIPDTSIGFNDAATGSGTTPGGQGNNLGMGMGMGMMGMGMTGSTANTSDPSLSTASRSAASAGNLRARGIANTLSHPGATGAEGSGATTKSSSFDPSALASLAGTTNDALGPEMQLVRTGVVPGIAAGKQPNIFEYNSYRIRKVSHAGHLKHMPASNLRAGIDQNRRGQG